MALELRFVSSFFTRSKKTVRNVFLKQERDIQSQDLTLKKMLYKARNTQLGKHYGFDKILIQKDVQNEFRKRVPIHNYELMHNWWSLEFAGERNVSWPGIPKFFAMSSGTSQGSSKFIPVTNDQLKAMLRGGKRQLFSIFKTDIPKNFLAKHYLQLGGSTDLNFDGLKYSGDLSGILSSRFPFWFERLSKPSKEIRFEKDWYQKMERMVAEAPNWDVAILSGGPAWIKMLLERIIQRYELRNIHELWPNLTVYSWGATSISPYKKQIDDMLGKPIYYFESYIASEGFISFQKKLNSTGMGLAFRNNMFFEFLPFNEVNFDEDGELTKNARAIGIKDVEEGVNYAIVITTCAGAWRYLIGDTIEFTNAAASEIKITGRTKQYLSLCGEHLTVDNMNQGIERTALELNLNIAEYSVRGLKYPDGSLGHCWFIAYPTAMKKPSIEIVRNSLDKHLCVLNDDYATERAHVLKKMELFLIPDIDFIDFMEIRGKLGGQAKFPRVMAETVYQEWAKFLGARHQIDIFA